MSEERRTCQSAGDRTAGRTRLHDLLARPTGELRAHVPDDLVAPRYVLDHLADILAEVTQCPAASGARAGGGVNDLLARQVCRQSTAHRLYRSWLRRRPQRLGRLGPRGLEGLPGGPHLGGLGIKLVLGGAVLHAVEECDLKTPVFQL